MTTAEDPRYLKYFKLFDEEKFFEAHEVLEDLWRETKGQERDFYQGLIQLAAALVHYQKNHLTGSQELYRKASRYLKACPPDFGGVAVSALLKDFQAFLAAWSQDPENPLLARKLIPRIGWYRHAAKEKDRTQKI